MKLRALLGFTYGTLIVVLTFALVFRYFGPEESEAIAPASQPFLGGVEAAIDRADPEKPLLAEGRDSGGGIQSKATLP